MTITPVAAALALLGFVYLLSKSVFFDYVAIDFPFIWMAGHLWNMGVDPYASDLFQAAGAQAFPTIDPPLEHWFYPPSWWPVASALALLDYDQALWLWRTLGAALLCHGVYLVASGLRSRGTQVPLAAVLLALAWGCLFAGTVHTLMLGQTSLLVAWGACLYVHALLTGRTVLLVVALVTVMLKPQVGLPLCFALLAWPRFWLPLALGGALSLAAAAPALSLTGLGPFIELYRGNLGRYADFVYNLPHNMTGVQHLVWLLSGHHTATLLLTASGALGALALGGFARARGLAPWQIAAAVVALVALVMPLHYNDLTIVVALPLLLLGAPPRLWWLALPGFLVLLRSNNVADALGVEYTTVASLALVPLAAAVFAALPWRWTQRAPDPTDPGAHAT